MLLVEDNAINRELVVDLLRGKEIEVDWADNGQRALDMVAAHAYDGVLMDCQMPIMDGCTASQAIRERDGADIPIIAMTANVMAGDRRKALDAGVNDHVAKPIDVDAMFITLARWIHPRATTRVQKEPTPVTREKNDGLPQLPGIDVSAGLKVAAGNVALYRRLLNRFRDEYAGFAEVFTAARQSGEGDAVRAAHTLKGVAANLGIEDLRQRALALEMACRHEPEQIDERWAETRLELERVLAGLAALNA